MFSLGISVITFFGIADAWSLLEIPNPDVFLYIWLLYMIICVIVISYLANKWGCVSGGFGTPTPYRPSFPSALCFYDKEIKGIKLLKTKYNKNFHKILLKKRYRSKKYKNNKKIFYKIAQDCLNIFAFYSEIYDYEEFQSIILEIEKVISDFNVNYNFHSINVGFIDIVEKIDKLDKKIYDIYDREIVIYDKECDLDIHHYEIFIPLIVDNKTLNTYVPDYVNGPMILNYNYIIKKYRRYNK